MPQPQPSFPSPKMIGQFRTFGDFGPAYRVIKPILDASTGEWLLKIQVLETGEETEYPYKQAIKDPEIH